MPRTTLAIDSDVLKILKERAARSGTTLQSITNDLLRKALAVNQEPPFKLELKGWRAQEQPGVDILDRDKLFDLMDGR